MKNLKKLMALATALTLAFSLNITSFAAETTTDETTYVQPKSSVTATLDGTTVTMKSADNTAADVVVQQDVNANGVTEDQIYVRAHYENGSEYALKQQTVTITSNKDVSSDEISFQKNGNVYTATVNMLNKAYDVTIGTEKVKLAAGLADGAVQIPSDDPLAVSNVTLAGVATTITGTDEENPFAGNPYYGEQEWTNVVYQIASVSDLPDGTTLGAVDGTMTIASGTTVTKGCASATDTGYTFRLNIANPSFVVSTSDDARTYYVAATMDGLMEVTYQINLSEVIDSTYYTGNVETQCKEILAAGEEYFGESSSAKQTGGVVLVPIGSDAMQPMIDFCTWATENNKFHFTTKNSGTYLATLDGLGEFSCGSSSGWMYTAGEYSSNCKGPNVGAASYTMTEGQTITWYMTTNYFNHF